MWIGGRDNPPNELLAHRPPALQTVSPDTIPLTSPSPPMTGKRNSFSPAFSEAQFTVHKTFTAHFTEAVGKIDAFIQKTFRNANITLIDGSNIFFLNKRNPGGPEWVDHDAKINLLRAIGKENEIVVVMKRDTFSTISQYFPVKRLLHDCRTKVCIVSLHIPICRSGSTHSDCMMSLPQAKVCLLSRSVPRAPWPRSNGFGFNGERPRVYEVAPDDRARRDDRQRDARDDRWRDDRRRDDRDDRWRDARDRRRDDRDDRLRDDRDDRRRDDRDLGDRLPHRQSTDFRHIYCEYDDVVLSNLYHMRRELHQAVSLPQVVSRDGGVLKDEAAVQLFRDFNPMIEVSLITAALSS